MQKVECTGNVTPPRTTPHRCRFCHSLCSRVLVSLGSSPLSNAFLTGEQLGQKERVYPLDLHICEECLLAQLPEFEKPEGLFRDYPYFSSYSQTWLRHAEEYVEKMIHLFGMGRNSHVVEIASNDGYLLQYFAQRGVPVLGVEPAENVAAVAQRKGIPTEVAFFGTETAKRLASEGRSADLLLGNNVLAHVPNLNDFVAGLKILLKPRGLLTMEFHYLIRLMEETQFDAIYHEHFSYFSLHTVEKVFAAHGLTIFDVEELSTHGGSLRIYVRHREDETRPPSRQLLELREQERESGYTEIKQYLSFSGRISRVKEEILKFLMEAKGEGKRIAGYGAPAKGNTLLNSCGVKRDLIEYTVDRNPYKQGRYLPGSHIPVKAPEKIRETRPDYLFILPWNIRDEIMEQMAFIREWNGKFVVPIPRVSVI